MKDLTKGNTFKVIFLFAIPMLIAGILSRTYSFIDLIIAGRFIGEDALAATGATMTLIQFLSALFWGMGVATATVCGELFGAKKQRELVTTMKTVLIVVTIALFVIALGCAIFSNEIFHLLKVDPDIFIEARSYFVIYMVALFFQAITFQVTSILQSLGNSKFPLLLTSLISVLNLSLNLVFVFAFKQGVSGLAWATVISCLLGLVVAIIKVFDTIKQLGGTVSYEFSSIHLHRVMKVAVPAILQQCSLHFASVAVQPLVNGLGKEASAGYSIAMNINLFLAAVYHSVSRAIASYGSQSKGAKQYENYSKGLRMAIIQQALLTAPFVLLCALFPVAIVQIFVTNTAINSISFATQYIEVCLPFIIFAVIGNLMHSFFRSVEAMKSVLFTTIIFMVARIGISYILPMGDHLFAVYFGLGLSWVIESLFVLGIYFSGIWKTKAHKQSEIINKQIKSA